MLNLDAKTDSYSPLSIQGMIVASMSLLLLLSFAPASAQKQVAGTITLSIGSAPAGTQVNDIVQIPVLLTSQSGSPADIIMFVEFETGKLEFIDAQLGPDVPASRDFTFFVDEDPLVTTVAMGTFEIGITPIPDGVVFLLDFQVLSTVPNDMIPIIADPSSSAANVDAESFAIILEDGLVDLSCPTVEAPTGVQASEGDLDGVTIVWDAVAGITEYRVFRSTTTDSSGAVPISGWITLTNFFDATADPPRTVQGSGCFSSPTTMLVTYHYFVKSRLTPNCESVFSVSDPGSRGTVGTKLYEKALPLLDGGEAYRIVDGASPIYLRLSADESLDPDTIWGDVISARGMFSNVAWQLVDEDNAADGWLVYAPRQNWTPGEIITMTGGGLSVSGAPVGPVSVQFLAVDSTWKEEASLTAAPNAYPSLDNAVSLAFAIGPEEAYAEPLQVTVPLFDANVEADRIELYYFDGASQRWRHAGQVQGWLASDTTLLRSDGHVYVRFLVHHGAVVRIAQNPSPRVNEASWIGPLNGNIGAFTPLLFAMVTLLLFGRRRRGSNAKQH